MPRLTLQQAQSLAGGRIQGVHGDAEIMLWAYDTRLPFREATACFVALAGPNRSGATYVDEAHQRGVRLFCVSENDRIDQKPDSTYWIVADALESLQSLAKAVRDNADHLDYVIGITGSNGKTIVKEWLYTLLGGAAKDVYRSPASFNSQLGVALSILHMPSTSRIAIFEAGISKVGEMQKLEKMIGPTLGILTNIGSAHDAGFSGSEEKTQEKLLLFKDSGEFIYRANNPTISKYAAAYATQRITWKVGQNKSTAYAVEFHEYKIQVFGSRFADETVLLESLIPFSDPASRENLSNAIIAALRCDVSAEKIKARIPSLRQADLRLSLTTGRQGCRLIDDTYNADIEGLAAALTFFSQHIQPNGARILVLGPLLESGLNDKQAAEQISQLLGAVQFDQLLTIGAPLQTLATAGKHRHFSTREELEAYLLRLDLSAATLLIKGPRALQLDRISSMLQRRTHSVRLEINLDTLAQNLAIFRAQLSPETKVCVMIKASAYGSGSIELVRFFEQRGVDYLAVANVDEGVDLRKAGTTLPILVANAQRSEFDRMVAFDLEAEVKSLSFLKEISKSGHQLKLHLKLDTGMHRLGFVVDGDEEDDLTHLLKELERSQYQVVSVFSHLIASDMAEGDEFSRKQNERLIYGADQIERVLGYRPMVHLLNSSGALRLPDFQHDMVRLGIGLYGVGSSQAYGLTPAHRLLAQVVQIKKVKAGGYVGYGLRGQSDVDRTIGVVNIGYADGLRREAGHGAYALTINERLYPTVGSICMDFCMVDLGADAHVHVGDEVEIFGAKRSIRDFAQVLGTIPYEVLTGIGQRVQRVYYR